MQKFRIIELFFASGLHWQFEVGKKFLRTAVSGYMFIGVHIKTLIHNSLYLFDNWG